MKCIVEAELTLYTESFEYSPTLHQPNQCACYHLMIFFIYSFILLGAAGMCGLLLNEIFFVSGGGGGGLCLVQS